MTLTMHLASRLLPSVALQIMAHVPLPFAVTVPELLTVATFSFVDDHVTFCLARILRQHGCLEFLCFAIVKRDFFVIQNNTCNSLIDPHLTGSCLL